MRKFIISILAIFLFSGCKKSSNDIIPVPAPIPSPESYYYPPLTSSDWQTKTAVSVGWNEAKLQEAFNYAGTKNTYGLIVLQHGKIIKEQYWNGWTANTPYFIASAGKSVVALLSGIAQKDGIININSKTSQYLGMGWTTLSPAKENLIMLRHNLSMTTGLDDNVPDQDCLTPSCLLYKTDAGTRWAYHNAPYRLMQNVLANASGINFNAYAKQKLFDKIGMPNSYWLNYIMHCTTREAARFGSLILKRGKWAGTDILADENYFNAMTNTSQNMNLSYGYLWWLNGKASRMVPGLQFIFNSPMIPEAPADMIMALGKDDKKIYVIPSLDAVVVRLGDAANVPAPGPSAFDSELWAKLKLAMAY